ncbi:MAG: CHASE2 domain-containing protein [Candidatus Omnitrophota bacterium]
MKKHSLRRLRKKTGVSITRFVRRYQLQKYALSLICALIILSIFKLHLLDRFELTLLDYRFKAATVSQKTSENIVLIDIAQDSIEQIGRWPWDRKWHAALISALSSYGVRAILYDVIFSEPSTDEQDKALGKAISDAGNVYLPYVFNIEETNSQALITEDSIYGIDSYMHSFKDAIKGDGFINILPDIDGILRRSPLLIKDNGKTHPQIAFKIACDMLGVDNKGIIIKEGAYIRLPIETYGSNIDIPVDDKYQMIINWPGGWKDGFKHFSFYDVISSFAKLKKGEEPDIPIEGLKNKICVVGMATSGLMDIKPTPIETLYPAMGVNASILDNILNENFCRQIPEAYVIALIFIIALITSKCVSIHRPLHDFFAAVIFIAIYTIAVSILFIYLKVWVNIIYPSATILFTYIGLTLYNGIQVNLEKKTLFKLATTDRLTSLFQKEHFNMLMGIKLDERRKGKKTSKLSLIMADVDFFKKINDTYGHLFGDVVLKKVAGTIKSASRPLDVCARYGGEEFIIMLPNTSLQEAVTVAERIRKTVEKKIFRYNKQSCKVTVSLGVATLKREKNQNLLIQRADSALYAAKQTGRNRVCKG